MAGGHSSEAYGINNAGQVVGEGDHDGFTRAFLKDPGQPMQDLGHLGGGVSHARGINDAGQVVGRSDFNDGVDYRGSSLLEEPRPTHAEPGHPGGLVERCRRHQQRRPGGGNLPSCPDLDEHMPGLS